MPAKLKVLKNGLIVDEFEIVKQSVLIGKGEHCDLILNFPGIGREMARVTAERDGYYLQDVSVQGVFIDGQRVTQQKINPGQEITCGAVQLVLGEEAGVGGPNAKETSSATMLWEAARFSQPATPAEEVVAYLCNKERPDQLIKLEGEEFVIGRSQTDVQLTLPDKSVSKRNTRIARAGVRFMLADLNSTNGTVLNGKKLTEIVELKEGDEIKIGKSVFLFKRHLGETGKVVKPKEISGMIDMAKLERQSTDLLPAAAPAALPQAKAASAPDRKKLLLFAVAGALVFLILVIAVKSRSGPKIDMARVAAVETALHDGKLSEARQQLDALSKQFPGDQRLKTLESQLAEAEKAASSQELTSLVQKARAREAAQDVVGATDLWAQVLKETPDNAEAQQKLGAAAYRIALVYQGKLPDADTASAIRYLEMIDKLVKKENCPDYDAAVKLLAEMKK